MLWQILTMRASSPSPTYDTPRPSRARNGSAILNCASGPDTTTDSRPALTTLALPDTGAASIATPRAAACSRTAADASVDTLEQSTKSLGALSARERTPLVPVTTSIRSSGPDTIVNTISRSARAAGESTIDAPNSAKGAAFAGVLLYTATSQPFFSSLEAMAKPMRPVPTQPSR